MNIMDNAAFSWIKSFIEQGICQHNYSAALWIGSFLLSAFNGSHYQAIRHLNHISLSVKKLDIYKNYQTENRKVPGKTAKLFL